MGFDFLAHQWHHFGAIIKKYEGMDDLPFFAI